MPLRNWWVKTLQKLTTNWKLKGWRKHWILHATKLKTQRRRWKTLMCILKKKNTKLSHFKRVCELESYSRRWNLELWHHGKFTGKFKKKFIEICQSILPEEKDKLQDATDVVYRLRKTAQANQKPWTIIIWFSLRSYKDAVWKSAKNHPFLCDNKLCFVEDLSQPVKEARLKMWPVIKAARNEGKPAYYVRARAFINGQEITWGNYVV